MEHEAFATRICPVEALLTNEAFAACPSGTAVGFIEHAPIRVEQSNTASLKRCIAHLFVKIAQPGALAKPDHRRHIAKERSLISLIFASVL
jgi:hypothetical protein